MRKLALLVAIIVAMLGLGVGPATATEPRTLVVDNDRVECATAQFATIQAAVDAAQPGDLVRVCPGHYPETVTVDKPLTLTADPDAVETLDCFDPTLGQLPATQQAIVDPAGDDFSVAFKLLADDIVLAGFVVQGASVGVDASDRFSGYQVHHNLVRLNTLFGVDFGSQGTRQSRVDHNCLRENRWGLVSELDDDSLWKDSDGPERDAWNARDLHNARIDHNATFGNGAGLEAAGPGHHDQVSFDHNLSREDRAGIALQNSRGSVIVDNELTSSRIAAILLGGANVDLTIASNLVTDGGIGILFRTAVGWIDRFSTTSRRVAVTGNTVHRMVFSGINANPGTADDPGDVHDSVFANNLSSDNGRDGIVLFAGNSGNQVRNNVTEHNGRNGIYAAGATGNTFQGNQMLGNATYDARDDARPSNIWIANQCGTDFPTGSICGIG